MLRTVYAPFDSKFQAGQWFSGLCRASQTGRSGRALQIDRQLLEPVADLLWQMRGGRDGAGAG